jgi:hypothetical protein
MTRCLVVPLTILLFAWQHSECFSQAAPDDAWAPKSVSTLRVLDLSRLGVVKSLPREGGFVVGLILTDEVEEQYVVEVPFVVAIEKTVTLPDGQTIIEPVTETRTQTLTKTRSKLEIRRHEAPVEGVRIWTPGGKSLPAADFLKALSDPKRCLLIDPNLPRTFEFEGDAFFASMLDKDVYIVWYDRAMLKDFQRK